MRRDGWLRNMALAGCMAALGAPVAAAAQVAGQSVREPSTLPFQAPRFDIIHDSDFLPAFEQGMAEQSQKSRGSPNNPAPPTFGNTLIAMERSGRMLQRVQAAFSVLSQTDANPRDRQSRRPSRPKLAAHSDAIYLNPKLFARVEQVYDQRNQQHLDPEQHQLLKIVYQRFIRAGAQLSPADQAKLRAIKAELSTLQTAFSQKLLAATKAGGLVVDRSGGSSRGSASAEIAAAAQAAKARGLNGKWVIPLQNTTQQPALESLADRATRRQLFEQSWTRTEKGDANDTRQLIAQIAQLRAQKAALLGYPDWASFTLADQMAQTPQAAESFMAKLIPPTAAEEQREAAEIDQTIKSGGESFTVQPWDWERYAERVRKARFDIDQNEVKPYFELEHRAAEGRSSTQPTSSTASRSRNGTTFPSGDPDVRVFEVFDARREAPRPLLLRLFQARQQARRRLDQRVRVAVEAPRTRRPSSTMSQTFPSPHPASRS